MFKEQLNRAKGSSLTAYVVNTGLTAPAVLANLFARPCLKREAGLFLIVFSFEGDFIVYELFLIVSSPEFLMALSSILFLNLILSGDNAVIIAMASKNLPVDQRKTAIFWGSAGAVVLRVILTFIAAMMLNIPYLQFAGGLALLWIAIHLLDSKKEEENCEAAFSLRRAVQVILVADLIMSLDNVLALAAIAQTVPHNKYLLIGVGLATSIPMVVFGAQLLVKVLDRFPFTMYAGAGILGYAAAMLMLGDKSLGAFLQGYALLLQIGLTLGVMTCGYVRRRMASAAAKREAA